MGTVEFYFDFSSTNSYFAALLLPEICGRRAARLVWLPLHLAALFRGTGFDVMAMPRAKARYLWRDHERWAEATGLPFRRPSRFPVKTSGALRAVLAAKRLRPDDPEQAACLFSQGVFRAYWERDEDVGDRAVLAAVANAAGFDAAPLLEMADRADTREDLARIAGRAEGRGVFGAPTFFVGDEMFWGKDRLDFVERALERS